MSSNQHKVIVFSTPSCPWCARVKQYLQNNRIQFKDIDVSKDQSAAMEMMRRSGQNGVPQLWIDNRVVVGFDQNKIDQYLDIN